MLGNKDFIGLSLEGDLMRLAHLRVDNNTAKIVKLDQFSLVTEVKSSQKVQQPQLQTETAEQSESVFGFQEQHSNSDNGSEDDIDLSELDNDQADFNLDMADESQGMQSNEMLLYSVLADLELDDLKLGLNIPAGNAIYQIIQDTNFKKVDEDDLIADVEQKLESIYGQAQSPDNYAYEVRDDGSLVLVSIDGESPTLNIVNEAMDFYNGKLQIEEVIVDEVTLVGMVRLNYELSEDEMTCVIQCGKKASRVVFMKGNEIWHVAPLINEGTQSRSFLNTVFSKILFQLDTGEVPDLDRIVLANNPLGNEAVKFFKDNFPDIRVENMVLDRDRFDLSSVDAEAVPAFTTAIGTALAASNTAEKSFPALSLLPGYVEERQKVFKLQWHGIMLLFLLFLTPIVFNYFYTKNATEIENKTQELEQIDMQITQLQPIVETTLELENNLSLLREKLVLLDTLSQGTKEWSVKFGMLNSGITRVNSSWITSMSQSDDGTFVQGYSLNRNRIPQIMNLFEEATLLNVNYEQMREKEVYNFAILVRKFAADADAYAPSSPKEVQQIIEN